MSLGGLALGIGMLVDSSIVVLESIFRCREEGDETIRASIRGSQEVRGAVVASTLTSIAVFLPMVFVEGIAGQAFGDLGITVVISLLASLAVAIFFIPMLASRRRPELLQPGADHPDQTRWLAWQHYQSDARQWQGDRRRFLIPYLWLRLALASTLELIGKLLVFLIGLVCGLVTKGILPLLKRGFHFSTALPVAVMSRLLGQAQAAYPPLLNWALNHPAPMM